MNSKRRADVVARTSLITGWAAMSESRARMTGIDVLRGARCANRERRLADMPMELGQIPNV
jgi:hypothetical protein